MGEFPGGVDSLRASSDLGDETSAAGWKERLPWNRPADAPPRPIPLVLRQLPQASKPLTGLAAVVVVLSGVLPNAFILATGAVVGAVPDAVGAGFDSDAGRRMITALLVVGGLFVAQQAIAPLREAVVSILGSRVVANVSSRVMGASLRPSGIEHLESPATLDAITTAQGVGPGRIGPGHAVQGVLMLAELRLAALLSGVILAGFRWWLPLALLGFRFWSRRAGWKVMEEAMGHQITQTELMRRSTYLRELTLRSEAAKETRLFALGPWILDRFTANWHEAMEPVWKIRKKGDALIAKGALLIFGVDLIAFALLARAAAGGEISAAEVAVYAQAIFGIATVGFMRSEELLIRYGAASLPAAVQVEQISDDLVRAETAEPATGPQADVAGLPAEAIRFRDVGFTYPGAASPVFDALDLEIEAGRSLAIVGSNGAGKTTLVKLLARLYDPTDGVIEVDGRDLRTIPPPAWRSRLAAIFQDFVHYPLSVRDNVGFGSRTRSDDRTALEAAARRAGALDTIESLPHGWDTVLARDFEFGAELSGGQWQRIALARALFAVDGGAGVLVLDEPTANLDVRAEVELFDRFLELTAGLTTVLISHRFSTVRRADRIVVLEEGRAIESGTHDELMAAAGRYATMFRLQAARFTDEEVEVIGG